MDYLKDYLPLEVYEYCVNTSDKNLAEIIHLGYILRSYAKEYCPQNQSMDKIERILITNHAETVSLIDSVSNTKVPAIRGAIGENYVMDIIKPHFPTEYTGGNAKSADILISNNILVEVKHYSKTVPIAEVKKFQRDLNAKAVSGGVFISLTSTISRKKLFEYTREVVRGGTIPVIYISSNIPEVILLTIEIITNLITNQRVDANKIEIQLSALLDGTRGLSMVRANLHQAITDMNKNLSSVNAQILDAELNIKKAVDTITSSISTEIEVPNVQLDEIIQKYPMVYEKEFKYLANMALTPPIKLAKQVVTASSGIGFKFLKTKTQIFIDIKEETKKDILGYFDINTMMIKDSRLWIDIKPDNVTVIEKLIKMVL